MILLLLIVWGFLIIVSPKRAMTQVVKTEAAEIIIKEVTLDEHVVAMAKKYGIDEHIGREIIRCEGQVYGNVNNKNYQYTHTCIDTGKVKIVYQDKKIPVGFCTGEVSTATRHWSTDIGPWQLNDHWQEETAKSMGLDIYDDKENIEYGFWLYAKDGVKRWSASQHCHRMP